MDGVEWVILDGWNSDDWMVVDMGHIVVHCLLEEKRQQLHGTGETLDTWK